MPDIGQFSDNLIYQTTTIASGQTESSSIDLQGSTLVGIYMPSSWTTADLTYKASTDNSSFVAVKDDAGNTKTSTVGTNQFTLLDPVDFTGIRFLKLVSSASQGANRDIILVSRPV